MIKVNKGISTPKSKKFSGGINEVVQTHPSPCLTLKLQVSECLSFKQINSRVHPRLHYISGVLYIHIAVVDSLSTITRLNEFQFFSLEFHFIYSRISSGCLWRKTLTDSCPPCMQVMKRLNVKTEHFLSLWSVWLQANLIQKQYVLNKISQWFAQFHLKVGELFCFRTHFPYSFQLLCTIQKERRQRDAITSPSLTVSLVTMPIPLPAWKCLPVSFVSLYYLNPGKSRVRRVQNQEGHHGGLLKSHYTSLHHLYTQLAVKHIYLHKCSWDMN